MWLLAQVPDVSTLSFLKDAGLLGLCCAVLWFIDKRDRAWRKHDMRQSKQCHDAQREMLIVAGEMTLLSGRIAYLIERHDGKGPNDSQVARENPLRKKLEQLRKDQAESLAADEEDSSDEAKS